MFVQEAFISDLAQAGRESELSKRRFEEKIERLEQDAAQTRVDLAAAQIRLRDLEEQSRKERRSCGPSPDDDSSDNGQERITDHQRQITRYQSRLRDMAKLLDLTGKSPRKCDFLMYLT